jgi:CubicO group peptidase (beta-lactamase class C family)
MRLFAILLFFLPIAVFSQTVSNTETVGISTERLGRIDTFVNKYIQEGRLNGAVGLIMKDGKIVYYKSMGYSNIASRTPMQKDHIFRIASMTKPIVTTAVMMLWEKLTLYKKPLLTLMQKIRFSILKEVQLHLLLCIVYYMQIDKKETF